MKKNLLVCLMALALLFPGMALLSACNQPQVVSYEVVLAPNSEYTLSNGTITTGWGKDHNLGPEDFQVIATLDNNQTKTLAQDNTGKNGYIFGTSVTTTGITPIGDYTLRFLYQNLTPVTITLSVVKADVDMSLVAWNYAQAYTYNTQPQSVAITNLPSGVSVSYDGDNPTQTNAGQYTTTAHFTVADANHFNPIPDMQLTWQIQKATVSVDALAPVSFEYTGAALTVTKEMFAQSITLPQGVEIKEITGTLSATNAGTYSVQAIFDTTDPNSNNYNPIQPLDWHWTITPGTLENFGTVTLKEEYNLTYTGAAQSVELNTTGIASDVEVKSITGLTQTNAGTYEAVVEFNYIGANQNYASVAPARIEWSIAKAPLTLTANPCTIAYGQMLDADGVTPAGLVGRDTLSSLSGTLAYAFIDNLGAQIQTGAPVGQYRIVPSGLASQNYDITFAEGTLTIEKADLTIKANDKTIDYLTAATNAGVTPLGLVGDDSLSDFGTITYEYKDALGTPYTQGSDAGEYVISIASSVLNAPNYNITFISGTLTVQKIDVAQSVLDAIAGISLAESTFTYTGAAHTLEANMVPANVTVSGITVAQFTPVTSIEGTADSVLHAGTYQVELALAYADTKNYNPLAPITRTVLVSQHQVVLSDINYVALQDTTFTYDATAKTVALNPALIPFGVNILPQEQTSAINAGSYTAIFHAVPENLNDIAPFDAQVLDFDWQILTVALTVTANPHTIAYNTPAANSGVTYAGFVGGETAANLSGALTFAYKDALGADYVQGSNIGTYRIIPSGLTSQNYDIQFVEGTLTVETQTIDFTGHLFTTETTFIYNGTSQHPALDAFPEFAEGNVNIAYTIKNSSQQVVAESEDVGTYSITVLITALNSNYIVIGQSGIEAQNITYEITAQPISLENVSWGTQTQFGYTGQEVKPILTNLPENVSAEYSYTPDATSQNPGQDNITSQGDYVATVTLSPLSANFTLTNNSVPQTFAYSITKGQINVSTLIWTPSTTQVQYTGEAILPCFTQDSIGALPALATPVITYYQLGNQDPTPITSPILPGKYKAVATLKPVDETNYEIIGLTGAISEFAFEIIAEQITPAWSGLTGLSQGTESGEEGSLTLTQTASIAFTGSEIDISVNLGRSFEHGEITVDIIDAQTGLAPSIISAGTYQLIATITNNTAGTCFVKYSSLVLNLTVTHNAFSSLTLNGQDYPQETLLSGASPSFLLGSSLAFTLNDGYSLKNMDNTDATSPIVFDEFYANLTFALYHGQDFITNISFSDPYILGSYTLNGQTFTHDNSAPVLPLTQGQDSIAVNFDADILTNNNVYYYLFYIDDTLNQGAGSFNAVSTVPFTIPSATQLESVIITIVPKGELNGQNIHLTISQQAVVTSVGFNIVGLDGQTQEIQSGILPTNSILLGFTATGVATGESPAPVYTNITPYFDYALKTPVNIQDLGSYQNQSIYLNVKTDQGEHLTIVKVRVAHTFETVEGHQLDLSRLDTIYQTNGLTEFSITITETADNITLTSLLNAQERITLSSALTPNVDYALTINYTPAGASSPITYIFNSSLIITTGSPSSAVQSTRFNISNGTINLENAYNPLTISSLTPQNLGLYVSEGSITQTLIFVQDNIWFAQVDYEDFEATSHTTYLPIVFQDHYLYGSKWAEAELYLPTLTTEDYETVKQSWQETTFTITDLSTIFLMVVPQNPYITLALYSGTTTTPENLLADSLQDGYLVYKFILAGTYTLIATAPDGQTTITKTIEVQGTAVLFLGTTIGQDSYASFEDTYGATGDFVSNANGDLVAYVGAHHKPATAGDPVHISSLTGALVDNPEVIEFKTLDGTIIPKSTLATGFDLAVQDFDTAAPYVQLWVASNAQTQGVKFVYTSYIRMYLIDTPSQLMSISVSYYDVLTNQSYNQTISQQMVGEEGDLVGDFKTTMLAPTTYYLEGYLDTTFISKISSAGTFTIDTFTLAMPSATLFDEVLGAAVAPNQTGALTLKVHAPTPEDIPYMMFSATFTPPIQGAPQVTAIIKIMFGFESIQLAPTSLYVSYLKGGLAQEFTARNIGSEQTPAYAGDFTAEVNDGTTTFTAYIGAQTTMPTTFTLKTLYTTFSGEVFDLGSLTPTTPITDPSLHTWTVVGGMVSIGIGSNVVVNLILADRTTFPATLTIGQDSYGFTLNSNGSQLGQFEFMNGVAYIGITGQPQQFTITLNQAFEDFSYSVISDDKTFYEIYYNTHSVASSASAGKIHTAQDGIVTAPLTYNQLEDGTVYAQAYILIEGTSGTITGPEIQVHMLTILFIVVA